MKLLNGTNFEDIENPAFNSNRDINNICDKNEDNNNNNKNNKLE